MKFNTIRLKQKQQAESERLEELEERKLRKKEARESLADVYREEQARLDQIEAETGEKVFRLADEHESAEDHHVILHRCEVCEKSFKSEKQMSNHEESKKHKQAVKELQRQLLFEEELLRQAESAEMSDIDEEPVDFSSEEELQVEALRCSKSESDDDSDSSVDFGAFGRSRHDSTHSVLEEDHEVEAEVIFEENAVAEVNNNSDEKAERDLLSAENITDVANDKSDDQVHGDRLNESGSSDMDHEKIGLDEPVVLKRIAKVSKSAVKQQEITPHYCSTCSCYFGSRNKLFQHLKKTNHAEAQVAQPPPSKKKGKKKK